MEQEKAQVLFHEGATLIFLDVPEGTEFGIDYYSCETGDKFKGVKMIPPGLHFVYYSAQDNFGGTAARTGFFHFFRRKEVLIKKWDHSTSDVMDEDASEEEIEKFTENKKEMDRFLGPYPYDNYKKWISLSNHITEDLLARLEPRNQKLCSAPSFISEPSTTESRREDAAAGTSPGTSDGGLPIMVPVPGSMLRLTEIPTRKYPVGASPAEVTKLSMDSSYALSLLLQTYDDAENTYSILGEIQFTFICFLLGQVYDGFEHWKRLVSLLCTSEAALHTHSDLFMMFIQMLHYQIQEIPEDFFVDIVSQNNFLTSTLHELFTNLEENNVEHKLRNRGLKFRDYLTRRFKWDFTSEPDDYSPVVVDEV